MKRLVTFASLIALLSILVTNAEAADGGATITSFPVSFVLTSATCSSLPAGTTVTGSGTEKAITRVRTDATGVTTIIGEAHAYGTATDQAGNTYVFNYDSPYRISNSAADPTRYTGSMSDVFTINGNGPAGVRNGFVASFTVDASNIADFATWSVTWGRVRSYGDPISFQNGPFVSHCDPL